ncbi:hypothetical protein BHM03_00003838 [Ensete ventricosum]|uniref:Uncharacterized protein n=1 Tax=Ensete ventricosum TaxID=4639 RepID=A0A445MA60_ENSVE|nr:hypothetical protein BHM03_00003838 [Ensete ventricosum]
MRRDLPPRHRGSRCDGAARCPCSRRCCPRVAPHGRAVPPCAGTAPIRAAALIGGSHGRGVAPCGLAAGSRPCGLAAGDCPLRPSRGRLPLTAWLQALPTPQAPPLQAPAMPAGDHACWRLPLQGALAMVGRPLTGGLGRSWMPLQPTWSWVADPAWGLIRMVKIEEVMHPPV